MTLVEALLIAAALSLNVFLIAEYEGSNLKDLNPIKVCLICLIFLAEQAAAFGIGYGVTRFDVLDQVPHVTRQALYVNAAVIYFVLGAIMCHKVLKKEVLIERLQELKYGRIALETLTVGLFTSIAGFACGLLNLPVLGTFVTLACASILGGVIGLFTGYYQGCRFRKPLYGISCALFVGLGVEVLIRYI